MRISDWSSDVCSSDLPDTAARFGVADNDWVALSSQHSQIVVPVRLAGNVQPDTVWTWNAIGKRRGAWRLDTNAPESTQGFLLNHLIDDRLPDRSEEHTSDLQSLMRTTYSVFCLQKKTNLQIRLIHPIHLTN